MELGASSDIKHMNVAGRSAAHKIDIDKPLYQYVKYHSIGISEWGIISGMVRGHDPKKQDQRAGTLQREVKGKSPHQLGCHRGPSGCRSEAMRRFSGSPKAQRHRQVPPDGKYEHE